MQKTKIICTMGPASDSISTLKELIRAGMTVARLNMAHGELDDHVKRMQNIRQAAEELHTYVPIMMDIKGPEVRIGKLKEASCKLVPGEVLILTTEDVLGDEKRISVNYDELPLVVKTGDRILIDDGLIDLTVIEVKGNDIHCSIISGGTLKPRKGVNLPGIKTTLPGVTERDIKHIQFGLANNVEIIAASFVRKAADIMEIREILEKSNAEHVQIISKIENEEGILNLEEIIRVSDGIMVARGDLGVEVPIEDVPMMQLDMINKCNLVGKPVIVATHMLESMQVNPRPTRAEVSDVANAVLQGADVVMLSGETAAGKYPIESVQTMASIAKRAESMINYDEQFKRNRAMHSSNVTEIISQAVVNSSLELNAKAILVSTESGFTARMVSKYRPEAPIIAITQHEHVRAKICLLSGVIPIKGHAVKTTDEMFESAIENAKTTKLIDSGDIVVLTAGVPVGKAGNTNLLKVTQV